MVIEGLVDPNGRRATCRAREAAISGGGGQPLRQGGRLLTSGTTISGAARCRISAVRRTGDTLRWEGVRVNACACSRERRGGRVIQQVAVRAACRRRLAVSEYWRVARRRPRGAQATARGTARAVVACRTEASRAMSMVAHDWAAVDAMSPATLYPPSSSSLGDAHKMPLRQIRFRWHVWYCSRGRFKATGELLLKRAEGVSPEGQTERAAVQAGRALRPGSNYETETSAPP